MPLGLVLWAALVLVGLKLVKDYKSAAGELREAPAQWPAGSTIPTTPGLYSLVMFVHPKCDCSRASLDELQAIMAAHSARAKAFVVFLHPDGVTDDWEQTATWRKVEAISGAVRLIDRDGTEANRFGAATSGQLVVYDPSGRLVFSGGITGSRGHAGDNLGRESVLALLAGRPAPSASHAVYGCSLHPPVGQGSAP